MQKTSLSNIVRFVVQNPQRLPLLINKIWTRIKEKGVQTDMIWIQSHEIDFSNWAGALDSLLWNEAQLFADELKSKAFHKLSKLNVSVGGGGIYPILYFITRYYQPGTIVETGVAAGYSSQAFLSAISKNDKGKLYSSDFPYFRLKNPEAYIGILVDEHLKYNWQLYTEGDEKNLPLILKQINRVDFFHYDSDKSLKGRQFAWNLIVKRLHEGSILVFDDIQDNNYFKNFVENHTCSFHVFRFQNKYAGFVHQLKLK